MRLIYFLLLSLFASSCQETQAQQPTPKSDYIEIVEGRVINVKDGDSFTIVDKDDKFHEIRLSHVDTPEKKQAFGRKAQLYTFNFTFGKIVTAYVESKDRYHRKISEVLVEGENLNEGIIRNGLAWHFKKYSKSNLYGNLELAARNKKAGLWIDTNAKPPWEFRKRKPKKTVKK